MALKKTKEEESRIQAYFDEFDWLGRYIHPSGVSEASASRITSDFLTRKPGKEMIAWDMLGPATYAWEKIYLLDKSGNEIGQVGYIPAPPDPNFRWWKIWKLFNDKRLDENVSDALARLGDKSGQVTQALYLSHGRWNGDYQLRKVVILKSPKGFNLDNWTGQLQQRAQNIVKQQLVAINSEFEIVKK